MVEDSVQVVLRIRPLLQSEIDKSIVNWYDYSPRLPELIISDAAFTQENIFPQHITQQEFYDTAVKGLIGKLFEGYNTSVLAYGQSGSGKTYTMGTNYLGSDGDSTKLGVIPQAVADIFHFIDTHEDKFEFRVSVSFLELYQEQCYDLLSDKSRRYSFIDIVEDVNKGVILPGITEQLVTSTMEAMNVLARGSRRRTTRYTAMNQTSSRSHAVFTVCVAKESRVDKNIATTSKFHLVDLAGSGCITQVSGNRLDEEVKINQGLLALRDVILALGGGTNRSLISYRDNTLTKLLQDSLGGNSLMLLVACVSPAVCDMEFSVSTLECAARACRMRNQPTINYHHHHHHQRHATPVRVAIPRFISQEMFKPSPPLSSLNTAMVDASTQSVLTLPPVLPPEVEKLLQPFCNYTQDQNISGDYEMTLAEKHSDMEQRPVSSFGTHELVVFSPDLMDCNLKRDFGTLLGRRTSTPKPKLIQRAVRRLTIPITPDSSIQQLVKKYSLKHKTQEILRKTRKLDGKNLISETPKCESTVILHEISKIRASGVKSPLSMSLDNNIDGDNPLNLEDKKADLNNIHLKLLTGNTQSDYTANATKVAGDTSTSCKRVDRACNENTYANASSAIKPSELTIISKLNSGKTAQKELTDVPWKRVDRGFEGEASTDSTQTLIEDLDRLLKVTNKNDARSLKGPEVFNGDITYTCRFSLTPLKSPRM